MKEHDDDVSALQLLAATRHPEGDQVLRRLTIAEKLFPWIKGFVALLVAAFGILLHAEVKLAGIDKNRDTIEEHGRDILELKRHDDKLDDFKSQIDQRRANFDTNFVPKVALWDETVVEWRAFSLGADSDLAHLRELWLIRHMPIPPKTAN